MGLARSSIRSNITANSRRASYYSANQCMIGFGACDPRHGTLLVSSMLPAAIHPESGRVKDEEIVLVDEAGTAEPDWEGSGGPSEMQVHDLVSRRP